MELSRGTDATPVPSLPEPCDSQEVSETSIMSRWEEQKCFSNVDTKEAERFGGGGELWSPLSLFRGLYFLAFLI